MWSIGQEVTCVYDRFPGAVFEWGNQLPAAGEKYTIADISQPPHWLTGKPGLAFLLAELKNPRDRLGFSAWRFRPLEHVESDSALAAVSSVNKGEWDSARWRSGQSRLT